MKNRKHAKRVVALLLTICLLMGVSCIGVFAKETCHTGWENGYYVKGCFEDGNRSNFLGGAMAGRNTENRDTATKRMAGSAVIMVGWKTVKLTVSVKDWKTGSTIMNFSSNDPEVYRYFNYSSPISVFACTEATHMNGEYICAYPTSVAW